MKRIACVFVVLIGWACNPKPEPHIHNGIAVMDAAREIMLAGTCSLITVNENAQPFARVMDPLDPDADFVVWLATNARSRKLEHIKSNNYVVLHYVDHMDNGYVSLYGKAELVRDTIAINEHWKPEWDQFYPNRNADCVLIKVQPVRLEVINYRAGITGDPLTWQPEVIMF
ncbi:MAG: pyridoxamine 5'-phosphate oxidase family protein [Cyclobacteriaceae bacterium]|nr:pyridoxamine 5'-phosphate oxidase family protein [Cyclobacteriaceae bacterium]